MPLLWYLRKSFNPLLWLALTIAPIAGRADEIVAVGGVLAHLSSFDSRWERYHAGSRQSGAVDQDVVGVEGRDTMVQPRSKGRRVVEEAEGIPDDLGEQFDGFAEEAELERGAPAFAAIRRAAPPHHPERQPGCRTSQAAWALVRHRLPAATWHCQKCQHASQLVACAVAGRWRAGDCGDIE